MDNLISREAALAICDKEYKERLKMADYCGDTVAWNIGGAIKELSAVDPVKHGGWEPVSSDGDADGYPVWDIWGCSECGEEFESEPCPPEYNFCPNCGAKMDGGEDDD